MSDLADQSGVRPRRRPPDQLRAWVFRQHQVWVDRDDNEHEIESMPAGDVLNVIRFCRQMSERIKLLVSFDELCEGLELTLLEGRAIESRERQMHALSIVLCDSDQFLEMTPLMRALRRRHERLTDTNRSC
jgi:hypothetical protein